MTEEDKNLLIQDLCARLPYNIKVWHEDGIFNIDSISSIYGEIHLDIIDNYTIDVSEVKPYLFPLSSMTEEQKKFFKDRPIFLDSENELVVKEDFFGNSRFTMLEDWMEVILWLVKNHFDYRGLIPKGLAIDCTNLNIY